MNELIGTAEAARLLGVTQRGVRKMCERGDLESAQHPARDWLIDRAEVEARVRARERVAA